jgi:hypothetical protein
MKTRRSSLSAFKNVKETGADIPPAPCIMPAIKPGGAAQRVLSD